MSEYAPFTAIGDFNETDYTIGFDFIASEHVEVYVDDVLQVVDGDYVWELNFTVVSILTPPPAGDVILIKRVTPRILPIVDFNTGKVTELNLDDSARQALYVLNELRYDLGVGRETRVPAFLETTVDQIGMWPGSTSTVVAVTELSGHTDPDFNGTNWYEMSVRITGGEDLRAVFLHIGPLGTVVDPVAAASTAFDNTNIAVPWRNALIVAFMFQPDADDIITVGCTFDQDSGADEVFGQSNIPRCSLLVRRVT